MSRQQKEWGGTIGMKASRSPGGATKDGSLHTKIKREHLDKRQQQTVLSSKRR